MADLWGEIKGKIAEIGGNWATYTMLGSFALYVLGYLTLRFHLTFLGIGTDLSVLDERYLFTGMRFVVYLVSAVPNIVMLVLLAVAPFYLPYRILPLGVRTRVAVYIGEYSQKLWSWWSDPARLSMTGIILSVLLIQLVMRQCWLFSDLLLTPTLPNAPRWLLSLLLGQNEGLMALYFGGLVAGTAVCLSIFLMVREQPGSGAWSQFCRWLLGFLVTVQILMIPVNYGVLVIDQSIPRVASLRGDAPLDTGQHAWLIWEGREGVTYLVRETKEGTTSKTLVTLPRSEVKKIEIKANDRILKILFPGHN